jgi:nicotinamidase-related amidase
MKALLIIDMQNVCFTPATPRFDAEGVTKRINRLSAEFRKKKLPVIFVQHDGTKENYCIPGTEEWQIIPQLVRTETDLTVPKTANDSFYRTGLKETLDRYNIRELVITGCATDFCVDSTVKSALVNDYNVMVISDGHTTADRPALKAEQLINHYNWLWSEMAPTLGKISVTGVEDYLNIF